MTMVGKIEGPVRPGDFIEKLTRVMEDNETALIAARADREERSFNQTLRREQDLAYEESLKADQEKERKKQEERNAKQKEEDDVKQKELDEINRLEDVARKKEEYDHDLPSEPSSDDPNSIRIVLKLPSGKRLERRFLKSQSLKYLYYFVFCNEDAPDDFQIVTNFPRKVLPVEPTKNNPEPVSFEEIGLKQTEMLFVHDNEA